MTEEISLNYAKVEWTYGDAPSGSDAQGHSIPLENGTVADIRVEQMNNSADRFEFEPAPQEAVLIGLLLPAVQKLDENDKAGDSFDFKTPTESAAADDDHGDWIDLLSISTPTASQAKDEEVRKAGLRSDGELVQAVSEADMSGDFIL